MSHLENIIKKGEVMVNSGKERFTFHEKKKPKNMKATRNGVRLHCDLITDPSFK